MGKFLIVGIIAAVILIETGLAFYFIPDSKQVTAQFREEIKNELVKEFDGDEDLLNETEGMADELVRMFGGKGVRIEVED